MLSTEEYRAIISDLLDELPEAFFRDLTGGVIMSEALVIPDYARGNLLRPAADRDVQGLL